MKILLIILTFHLISGPVHCSDVIGYPGGYIIIDFKHPINIKSTVYFCKFKTQTVREPLITAQGSQLLTGVHKDRFTLFGSSGLFTLIFRNLSLQDTGIYQIGEFGLAGNHNINLKVNSDPCCSGTRTVTGYLGQTVTISCSYPREFITNTKSFFKLDGLSVNEVILTSGREPDGRFSISDDGRNKVFSVNINDVREDDGGVYFCAVDNEGTAVNYHSLFTAIQLQVIEVPQDTTENPDGTSDTTQPEVTSDTTENPDTSDALQPGSSLIITMCVCVTVLLLGVFVLIYKLKSNKSQDSASISQQTNNMTADYENNPSQIQNIIMRPVYQNLNPNTNQSDSVYQSLDPNTNQPESVYQSLDPNTNQPESVYQTLKQLDSVYCNFQFSSSSSDLVHCNANHVSP
ncbi:polymeric immunoglobulin receptor-like isoform X2 [Pangasianodon hypophthalmus]|uniref:polymeric immunoglobulin receptor-like isoform X2 n=1 Tax=Pangasianodon hypophthalmus TaxID=310915 RepID=UPI002307D1EF|nr:polymeric immunoglobulin receptor-like isoform X2 [Pangasianodon hypophthalmus]